ncbi:MAG: GGDEF domain-containing protein [Ignavibacteriales bacterium]
MGLYVLIIFNLILIIYIFYLLRQLDIFQKLKKNYSSVVILQKIMEIMGKKISGQEKLEEINEILIKENDIMYSTIVSYDGDNHIIQASNVNTAYHDVFKEVIEEPIFKNNVLKNVPKYVTSPYGEAIKYSSALERGIRSAMMMPLYLNDSYAGYWLIEDKNPNAFDRFEKIQLSILKNNLVLIIESSNYQSTIEKMAVSDRLTGLFNRYYLYSRGRSLINDYPISTVVIADIDHFKRINDTYGHDVGDKVLVNMVQTTLKCLTKQDIFVRFGGEEFVILLPGKSPNESKQRIDEIRETISREKFDTSNNEFINVTVSYGMSSFQPGGNLDAVLKNADIALYRAKENGRNRIEIG